MLNITKYDGKSAISMPEGDDYSSNKALEASGEGVYKDT